MTDGQALAILRVLERIADGLEEITSCLSCIDEDLIKPDMKRTAPSE